MGYARVRVSLKLLKDLLCLPNTCDIVLIDMAPGYSCYAAMFTLKSPDFPEQDVIPEIIPTFEKVNGATRLKDWNYSEKENAV